MTIDTATRLHHLLDHHAVTRADRIGWTGHDGEQVTYGDMGERVAVHVDRMKALGVVPGDRVMIIAENGVDLVVSLLTAWACDAWAMPVNARLSEGEIDRLREHAEPRLTLFPIAASGESHAHAKRLGAQGERPIRFLVDEKVVPEPAFDDPAEQTAALMYTTGTTGNPKGVRLSHNNLLWNAAQSTKLRGLTGDDHTYCALPLTHIFGLASVMLANLHQGAHLQLVNRFDPAHMLNALRDGVTILPAVPAMYAHLLEEAKRQGLTHLHDLPLKFMLTGGAPLDADWKHRIEDFFGLPLHNGYGMTECAPGIASSRYETDEDAAGDISCGPPLDDLDVRVVPAPEQDDLVDGVGEIIVRGPNIMQGYYKNPEETAKVMDSDGFFHTGDLGHYDEKGRLHVDGRCKELIIRSGFNVYPPEVESALSLHPDVVLAAVVGRKVPGNEEVLAFVQRAAGSDLSEAGLRDYVSTELAPYKVPARIVIADGLPASSTGKILKAKLIETFADHL